MFTIFPVLMNQKLTKNVDFFLRVFLFLIKCKLMQKTDTLTLAVPCVYRNGHLVDFFLSM
jgi:hypothetical protein